MNDELEQLEEVVRQQLDHQATDVPDTDAMRGRVLAALQQDAVAAARNEPPSRRRRGGPIFLLAGVAAVLAIVAFIIVGGDTSSVNVTTVEPVTGIPNERYDSTKLRIALNLTPPVESEGDWILLAETPTELTLQFVSPPPDADRSRILRIVAPPPGTTPDDVLSSLSSTLFDTILTNDTVGEIGGFETRVARLETQDGTTRLAFKIASDTYLETSGEDRVFLAHSTATEPETLVFWIEAAPEDIDDFEAIADRLLVSLSR